jgi:hypothetical protein
VKAKRHSGRASPFAIGSWQHFPTLRLSWKRQIHRAPCIKRPNARSLAVGFSSQNQSWKLSRSRGQPKFDPGGPLPVSVSIPVSSRLIGGSGHPTSPLQGALHPARWRRLPPRPKGMHRRTYEKTARRYEAYKTIMDQDLIAALARMMR